MRKLICTGGYLAFLMASILAYGMGKPDFAWLLFLGGPLWSSVCTLTGWNPSMDEYSQWYRTVYGWSMIVFVAVVVLLVWIPISWKVKIVCLVLSLTIGSAFTIWAHQKEKQRQK